MIGKPYPFFSKTYISEADVLFYVFISKGKKNIPKVILFAPIVKRKTRYYNWGFGDLVVGENGEYLVDDRVETNNGDVRKVFYTIVSSLYNFFEVHPEATVYVEGSSRQRIEIYRQLIFRHWEEIEPFYHITGGINGQIEEFQSDVGYEYLLISRRKR